MRSNVVKLKLSLTVHVTIVLQQNIEMKFVYLSY